LGAVRRTFVITRLEGKWKMNQNRETQDRLGVVRGLGDRGPADDLEMADFVSRSVAADDR
jgi:predicted FMN-binding regulatory protein PaiB